MKKSRYCQIFKLLLDELVEEEKITETQKHNINSLVDDYIYDGSIREYTLGKFNDEFNSK